MAIDQIRRDLKRAVGLNSGNEIADILDVADVLSSTEAGYLDGVTAGTRTASKAVVVDANGKIDALDITALTINGTAVSATAAEINAAADVSSRLVSIPDGTTYTVLAANSGKTHVIPELTADITIDLPAAASGLEYTFIMGGVATEAQDWIFDTTAAANFYLGGLQFLDSDEPGSGSTLVPVYSDGDSNDIMTILTPQAGTRIHLICDGTNWIVNGVVFSATAPTFTDT